MTDAKLFAQVFAAAAEGVVKPYQQTGVVYSSSDYAHAKSMSGAFQAIADVFTKIAEAERNHSTTAVAEDR